MPGGRKPSWDTELGRLLWLDGKTDAQIAEELGATETVVRTVRLRRWQKGADRPQPEEVLPNEQAPAEASAEKSGGVADAHPVAEPSPEPRSWSMATPDGVYGILEEATKTKNGIEAICTADAILCLWNWDSADDLRRARAAISYLLRRLEG